MLDWNQEDHFFPFYLSRQLAGAMAEEGLPLETIVSRVNEAAKDIGECDGHWPG